MFCTYWYCVHMRDCYYHKQIIEIWAINLADIYDPKNCQRTITGKSQIKHNLTVLPICSVALISTCYYVYIIYRQHEVNTVTIIWWKSARFWVLLNFRYGYIVMSIFCLVPKFSYFDGENEPHQRACKSRQQSLDTKTKKRKEEAIKFHSKTKNTST